ncbi:MAG: Crp/Fnr family transcriptional regulator [Niabella sp.]
MNTHSGLIEGLVAFFRRFIQLTDKEVEELLLPHVTIKRFEKKQLVSIYGEQEEWLYFLNEGCMRQYYVKDEEETTILFAREGELISNTVSLFSRHPSHYFIEATEPCVAVAINYERLSVLMADHHKFEHLALLIAIQAMARKDERQLNLARLSPRERFLKFAKQQPEIMRRVPQIYIASYLGIKPETFSRFKHLLRKSKRS